MEKLKAPEEQLKYFNELFEKNSAYIRKRWIEFYTNLKLNGNPKSLKLIGGNLVLLNDHTFEMDLNKIVDEINSEEDHQLIKIVDIDRVKIREEYNRELELERLKFEELRKEEERIKKLQIEAKTNESARIELLKLQAEEKELEFKEEKEAIEREKQNNYFDLFVDKLENDFWSDNENIQNFDKISNFNLFDYRSFKNYREFLHAVYYNEQINNNSAIYYHVNRFYQDKKELIANFYNVKKYFEIF